MKRFRLIVILALVLVMATVGMASAQSPAYQTPFTTSVTYQNVGTTNATIVFSFYPEMNASPITVNQTLAAGAGTSLYLGSIDTLPANFTGSAILSSDANVVATLVQVPTSTTVKNRPLSNGFSSGATDVRIASVLKNTFSTTSRFSVQNADTGAIDITVKLYNAAAPTAAPISFVTSNVPVGAAKSFDMGTLTQLTAASFNGSAVISAVKSGTTTPANIVASAMELSTSGTAASAFEGASNSAPTVYMASALCNAFGSYNSYYAVQNTGAAATNVTVTYSNGKANTKSIEPGAKGSFNACEVADNNGFSGAATITTSPSTNIVVLGKVAGDSISAAFLGEASGSEKLALPYVRWTNDASYNAGSVQRSYIAIQNIGGSAVSGVEVQYLNKNGDVVGTQVLGSMASGAKLNSNASLATVASGQAATALTEFGTPAGNPGGGYGGAVIVKGPAGSQLVAVVRVTSKVGAATVGEDYNAIPIQ
jgi:hypothetical protein